MSYDISLTEPVTGKTVHFDIPHQMNGGTYAMGGTKEAWINITWNYARWYYRDDVFRKDGIRKIYGMSGADNIPVLKKRLNH